MIRDITIGQYYPADSPLHKLDPRVKLFATVAYVIALFTFKGIVGLALITAFLYGVIKISKVVVDRTATRYSASNINVFRFGDVDVHLCVCILVFAYYHRRCVLPEHKDIVVSVSKQILLKGKVIMRVICF